jgi:hypothetical protein
MENIKLIRGIYRDILTGPANQLLYDSGWHHNTIVDNGRILLAGLIKQDTFTGIHHLAVGRGDESWDAQWNTDIPPTSTPSDFDLVNPHEPPIDVGDMTLAYLDNQDNVVTTPTDRLQLTATLAAGYPPPPNPSQLKTYPLREFGLFGIFTSAGVETPYMINSVKHPVIHKDESATLTRIIRLSF